MSFFTQRFVKQLYVANKDASDKGVLYFILPENVEPPGNEISLAGALTNSKLAGSFVFVDQESKLDDKTAQGFVDSINNVIARSTARAIAWLKNPLEITPQNVSVMGLNDNGTQVNAGVQIPITSGLNLQVSAGMNLTLDQPQNTLILSGAQIQFSGPSTPKAHVVKQGTLPFSGQSRGCFLFDMCIERQSLNDKLNWGFQFFFPYKSDNQSDNIVWMPFASGIEPISTDMIEFLISIDPNDVFNSLYPDSTFFKFTGKNWDNTSTVLASYYRTVFGEPINLLPNTLGQDDDLQLARLFFSRGVPQATDSSDFHLSPEGDFVLTIKDAEDGKLYDLVCGLSGTEYIGFQPKSTSYAGDRLRFYSRKPAYASNYPFKEVSPIGSPIDLNGRLLDGTYLTSWATVVRAPDATGLIPYIAQPKGASLYGRDELIFKSSSTLFGHKDPSIGLSGNEHPFPLVPYAGMKAGNGITSFSKEQIEDFEHQVIGPTRRQAISDADFKYASSKSVCLKGTIEENSQSYNTATPMGLLATVGSEGRWTKILLAQNCKPTNRQMYLSNPDMELQQAFQTNQLFLVAANSTHLGNLAGDKSVSDPAFYNQMNIEDWCLQADVGKNNKYNDYSNILIIKGRKGVLFDPTSDQSKKDSLVSSPDKWTQRLSFAAPVIEENSIPDPDQLVILSQWLKDFFDEASKQTDSKYFQKFNSIARDPNWTGILILKMNIASLPHDLTGITAGVEALDRFNAHHFGIEISQVQNDPEASDIDLKDSSSMFGLIYYNDPEFKQPESGKQVNPVPPPSGADYNFRLLTLKVLFENTEIRDFESYAQLTLNSLFGMNAVGMGEEGNSYNTIILKGSYQNNNGHPVYSLGSIGDNFFYYNSNVFNKIEITSAQMSMRNVAESQTPVSWFGLSGFLDFKIVKSQYGAFDVLSFGSETDSKQTRRGLSFSNLGLEMLGNDTASQKMTFITDEIRFDIAASTPRAESLFINFAMDIDGLMKGTKDSKPSDAGYLPVITDATLTGVDGSTWYGLKYRLNMGTPGALAGKAGLTSYLLTAWTPESNGEGAYKALVGLQLPGTFGDSKLISIQNVLKLSIGQLRLTFDQSKSSFLLMFTEIALKFLGLLKIPLNGSTLFYLFGNPKSGGKPSGLGWYAMYRKDKAETEKK
ncbi:hypothetical protein [Clostridium magnum]|uniref:Uncharacterized protein n=1 Tax=Clostridium magnum DSM 2767 TaxID=1121326 RepID=A0A161YER4_9CLOT|nr:hypothetical protein [Clostridium magnum]KZL88482.1 hypothetical protein CLMAG_62540 [Clostridium magnum DSM 2767]SHI89742.1 hypothetical protein SAMN02745944_05022 [Clostridium magnum DSM 2767]